MIWLASGPVDIWSDSGATQRSPPCLTPPVIYSALLPTPRFRPQNYTRRLLSDVGHMPMEAAVRVHLAAAAAPAYLLSPLQIFVDRGRSLLAWTSSLILCALVNGITLTVSEEEAKRQFIFDDGSLSWQPARIVPPCQFVVGPTPSSRFIFALTSLLNANIYLQGSLIIV